MFWRGVAITFAAAAAILACGDSYEEAAAPGNDAGPDTSAADGSTPDHSPNDAGAPSDAGSDAAIDAAYNPCDAGFAPSTSGPCEIANPFQNPSFQQTGGWTTTGGAQILPSTAGPVDLGVARIREADSYVGAVDQKITLSPGLNDIPLAIHIAFGVSAPPNPFVGFPPIGVFSDGLPLLDWNYGLRPGGSARADESACLGEAALFGPRDISIRPLSSYYDRIDLDFVTLAPDPTCPPRAVVRNGNFETDDGWEFTSQIAYENGSGVGGSRGLRFKKPTSLSVATAHQFVSVPSVSMTLPALSFHVLGAGTFHLMMDQRMIARRHTTDADQTVTICMPEWSRGTVVDLALVSGGDQSQLEGDEVNQTFVIDNMSFIDTPSCAQSTVVANGDFENTDVDAPGWYLNAGFGHTFGRVAGDAHGGNGFLRITSTSDSCGPNGGSYPVAQSTVRIPDYDSTKVGPRVSFWYRFTPGVSATAEMVAPDVTLAPAATWTQVATCLDAEVPGTRHDLLIEMMARTSPCSSATLDIDDVVVDVDAACKP